MSSRLLKNYLRWQYCVKNGLKMLIYSSKLRFFGRFCLVLPASPTFFNGLLERSQAPRQIGLEIGDILQTDRHADQVIANPGTGSLGS